MNTPTRISREPVPELVALVRAFRKSLALTQAQMAGLIGVDRAHLSRLERGERKLTGEQEIRFNVLRQLAREPLLARAIKDAIK